jgi:hypothetical protein
MDTHFQDKNCCKPGHSRTNFTHVLRRGELKGMAVEFALASALDNEADGGAHVQHKGNLVDLVVHHHRLFALGGQQHHFQPHPVDLHMHLSKIKLSPRRNHRGT